MCLIGYLPKGQVMTVREFNEAWENNHDGFGMAVFKDGRWEVHRKIMNKDDALRLIETYKDYNKVVHFRLASVGGSHDDLTHPFETQKYIMFHNGTWVGWKEFYDRIFKVNDLFLTWMEYNQTMKYDESLVSDSKILAFMLYLLEVGKINEDKVWYNFDRAGKVVLIEKDKEDVRFIGQFEPEDKFGRVFSNKTYKPRSFFGKQLGIYDDNRPIIVILTEKLLSNSEFRRKFGAILSSSDYRKIEEEIQKELWGEYMFEHRDGKIILREPHGTFADSINRMMNFVEFFVKYLGLKTDREDWLTDFFNFMEDVMERIEEELRSKKN